MFNLKKKFKKFKDFKPTPGWRFAFAFWMGWTFHFAAQMVAMSLKDEHITFAIIAAVLAVVVVIMYSNNKVKFDKEFLWMTIKNPMKVKYEEDDQFKPAVHKSAGVVGTGTGNPFSRKIGQPGGYSPKSQPTPSRKPQPPKTQ